LWPILRGGHFLSRRVALRPFTVPIVQRDFYEILGVSRDASQRDIKRAFRRLARELHPDTNGQDLESEEKFKAMGEAYEVLSNPEQRRV
jgi:molecular chaperone DnaJ